MNLATGALPADPLAALRELTRTEEELGAIRRRKVEQARAAGATWELIGEALGMTRQSAWELYAQPVREALAARIAANDLDEDEALRLAVDEARASRARRGR